MTCYKTKGYIVLKNQDAWSVWKDNVKLIEVSTERTALKFVDSQQ